MSGFDNLMRTDQHIAQNRQFYDQQRYQSDRATAGIVGNFAANAQQSQMNQQAMEQQQLQGALMEKQVEADLRMQEATMEQQFHRNKLDQMLMMDQVQLSHEQVQGAKLANQNAQLAYEDRKRAYESSPKDKETARRIEMGKTLGLRGVALISGGYLDLKGNLVKFKDDKEKAAFLKNLAHDPREERLDRKDQADALWRKQQGALQEAKLKLDALGNDAYGDPKYSDTERASIFDGTDIRLPAAPRQPAPSRSTPPVNGETPQQGTLPANDNARRTFIGEQISTTSIDGRTTMDDSTKQFYINAIDEALPKLRELQRQVWAPGRQGKSDEELVRFVAKILSNGGHPRHQSMLRILEKAAPNAKWNK